MTDDRQRCVRSGCSDYLSKPIDRQQLVALCERLTAPA
jgi:CheY-like chemotaxis protein